MRQAARQLSRSLTKPASVVPIARMSTATATGLESFWMPFTDNVNFKENPRKIFERAEGAYFYLEDGTPIMDGMSGLWCCNAGHGQPRIVEAIREQASKLDFAPSFYTSHKLPFAFSEKILEMLPGRDFTQVFFTMCGSTAVDSALKMALQYQKARGQGSKVRFIGRQRGYHGVGFGGISVGGIVSNRKGFAGNMLPFVDHIAHTDCRAENAFTKGQPAYGQHLADDLETVIALHDASTIAAVIVEPVSGSTGVLPPPTGYLERLRAICDKHDILLIFDEVITGFGRLGTSFATEKFNVTPDMITCAKGLTNAAAPAGAVITRSHVFDTIQRAAHKGVNGHAIEFSHGYTYSGHPIAMAAGVAAQEVFKEQQIFENSASLAPYFEEKLHTLKGLPHVVDIRNIGMMGGVEFEVPEGTSPSARSMDVFDRCFEKGVLLRFTGATVPLSPPLICDKSDIDHIVDTLKESILESAEHCKV